MRSRWWSLAEWLYGAQGLSPFEDAVGASTATLALIVPNVEGERAQLALLSPGGPRPIARPRDPGEDLLAEPT